MRILILILLLASSTRAATIVASSTSAADVQTAITSSANGDTVSVPAGSSTWTTSVTTGNKRITIQGAGFSSTILTINLAGYGLQIQGPVRLTGVKMIYTAGTGLIYVLGLGYRIDRCRFETSVQATAIAVVGWDINNATYGLVDQCEFLNCSAIVSGYDLQDHVRWAEPNVFGTTNVNVFERNQYVNTIFNNSMDANYAGKYVFRHNTVIDSSIEAHSVQGSGRATKSWEIYKNTLIQSNQSMNFPFYIRGGTGVIVSNTVYGSWSNPDGFINNIRSSEFRFGSVSPYPLDADGGSVYDGNLTNGIPRATGSHTGGNNAATLTDSGQAWTLGAYSEWPAQCATNRWIYNITDGSKGKIATNTATTITATLAGGTDNDWDTGDTYKITGGYPARDQIGSGYDITQGSAGPTLSAQVAEVAHFWENRTSGGTLLNIRTSGSENTSIHLVEGRDFTNGLAKSGWTPLAYPHPRAVEEDSITPSRTGRLKGIRLVR